MQTTLDNLEQEIRCALGSDAGESLEWDSLNTLDVMALLVDKYKLAPDPASMSQMRTFTDLKVYIANLVANEVSL